MYLNEFHHQQQDRITISARQASRFAKEIADDFNPLHNADAKRFCVPGDLLFSLVLARYGVSQRMSFVFKGMVGDNTSLNFAPTDADDFHITDDKDKIYLEVSRSGKQHHNTDFIETLTRNYVAFSGRNFPHTLQPLLTANEVMINPDRPMVIYECMEFSIDHFDFENPTLEAAQADFSVNGKRGTADLNFLIKAGEQEVGRGFKRLLVSGLKPYDASVADALVQRYLDSKTAYLATNSSTEED
ncbi:MAG: DUF3581 domain-containing protein [Thiolinea sp.]